MDLSMILMDEINWGNFIFAPQYVTGKNLEMIPVYIGNNKITKKTENNLVGIYVNTDDYPKIDHDYPYIFINYPYINEEITNIVEQMYKNLEKIEDSISANREHIHIGQDYDEDEPTIH